MNSFSVNSEASHSSEFQENLSILRQISFFSRTSVEALRVFAYLCVRETFKAGDYLFRQGDDDGQAFYIISGKAELIRSEQNGEWVVQNYGEEDFLGTLALLGKINRLFSLRALTDMTCLILTREKFTKALEKFPKLIPKVLQNVAENITAWEEQSLVEPAGLCGACRDLYRRKCGVSLV